MATEISLDLINQLKISLRKQAKLSSFDPIADYSSVSSNLPTATEAISELDASAPYLRCRNCKGKFLRGIESLICVFCGKQLRTSDNPPDPIKFTSTSGYKLFLTSLNLDGSEMVEPIKETNGTSRVAKAAPVVKGIAVSKFLDLEIQWCALEEKEINSVENKNSLNLGGVNVDDFFVEEKKVDSVESKPEEEEDDFNDPRSLSLFDSVKSQGVVESQKNGNVGLFKGVDVQENVSSGKHESLSLFAGRDVQDSVSLAEQGNFGFFEGNYAQNSLKEDGNLSLFEDKDVQRNSSSKDDESFGLFEGKDAQRNSSSKDNDSFSLFDGKDAQRNSSSKVDESFGFFEGNDAQRNSSSKDNESFGLFEGKDAQRNSSSKDDESFGLFEGNDGQRNSSSKVDENFGFFEGNDGQRNSSSKVDESFGFFEGKDAQRTSSSKDDESFGFFEGAPSSNAGLKSSEDKVVASSSDWDSDFQSADRNLSQEKISGDPFVSSPIDMAAQMDSVFGSGKDFLPYEKTADSSIAYASKASDWLQDDLFGNVIGKTENNDPAVHDKNEGQVVGGNGSSSMDIDWMGDDLWQTNEKKPVEKVPTDDNDYDDDDDWNDFASSANKAPINPLPQTMPNSQEDIFERQNTGPSVISDIGKGQEDDLFGTWDSFTPSTALQTPVQPPSNHMNPSAKTNPDLFGTTNNHRDLDSDFFTESIGGQTNSEEVKAMPSGTSTLESTSDPAGKDQTLDPKSKSDIAEELMSQMHDLSFMLETKLSVPPISKTE
ncbi:hypothetical protein AALP_AA3G364700 [Arabis alpina]|uniref:DUF7815 domain-containing protein n=1 Tax=Arabis alpina TaxID=50452 RepID=A0A087HE17_ARAAL|nr:hypothetical protein AALP_AA3G364700 [Arabis alpina]